jgi:taurine--2-oxoglutarate transaminase
MTDRPRNRLVSVDEDCVIHSWMAQDDYRARMVVGAEGNYFWDSEGRRLLDFTSQAWYCGIGHGDRRVAEAIARQAHELPTIYGFGTRPKLELTERLLGLLPVDYGAVFYGCNGSDAVEAALKIARLVTGRQNVVAFHGEYHGASMGATSVTGLPGMRSGTGQPVPGTVFVPSPYHYRSPLAGATQAETDRATVDFLGQTLLQMDPGTVAALVGEPFSSGGGAVVPGPDYWKQVRALCDQYGIVLVADEIVSGFGRTGHWFARDHYDYVPDILCLAKGLTSGYLPLSAAVVTRSMLERFRGRPLPHGLTYSGHAVCCAAALATLDVIDGDDLVARAAKSGHHLAERLVELSERHPCVGHVQSLGLFAVIELVGDPATKAPLPGSAIVAEDLPAGAPGSQLVSWMERHGIVVRGRDSLVKVAPPLTVTTEEIDLAFDRLGEGLERLDRFTA